MTRWWMNLQMNKLTIWLLLLLFFVFLFFYSTFGCCCCFLFCFFILTIWLLSLFFVLFFILTIWLLLLFCFLLSPFGCYCFVFYSHHLVVVVVVLTIWLFANFWVPSPPPPSLCTLRPHLQIIRIFIWICNHRSWKEPSIFKTFPNKSVQFCTSKSFLFQKQVSNRRRYLSGNSHLVEQRGVEHEMGLFVWMGGGTEQIAKKKWTLRQTYFCIWYVDCPYGGFLL